ncbi:rhythmically expressed gene 5 protein [Anopheles ziemanni]|uniref:rhythmically expressed gene 5 protein n=1 Tax=Anopheles coustani TaxID=139045 RepID=UPI00265B4275|nr:rhythmically expressed gene 5 protein [Anopheles coustani]XP_058167055.1 rhythmically expressed gene 5 protein [Anopheles ziemanni]
MAAGRKVSLSAAVIVVSSLVTACSGSAIPMWEFLSRGEKMSHLYTMFAKQVSSYCKGSQDMPTNMCKRNLLMYGINKLQDMNESHLDSMDPYQRGATDIIWDAMMDGHTKNGKRKTQTTAAPAYIMSEQYEHNPLFDDPAPTDGVRKSAGSISKYGMDYDYGNGPTGMEVQYAEPQNHLPQEASTNVDYSYQYRPAPSTHFNNLAPYEQTSNYLTGPMVVRLRPDGTPVEEDKVQPTQPRVPKDDDIKEMTLGKEKMPSFQQIYDSLKQNEEHHLPSTVAPVSSTTTTTTTALPPTYAAPLPAVAPTQQVYAFVQRLPNYLRSYRTAYRVYNAH